MAPLITLFEDYQQQLEDYKDHETNLEHLEQLVGIENFNLQSNGKISIAHYIGFFAKGNTRLQVLPKIYSNTSIKSGTSEEIDQALRFVFYLLRETGFVNNIQVSPQLISENDNDLLEIFIELFAREFCELISKKIFRQYIDFEENQQFIKGKILFSESIKKNAGLHHVHYVRYDEYSSNNLLNRVFKTILLKLLLATRQSRNKQLLVIALSHLEDIDLLHLTPDLLKQVRFDRLNNEFEALFNMAKLFFKNLQPGVSAGGENTYSFLIKLNELFEVYVGKALDELSSNGYSFHYHEPCEHLAQLNGTDVSLLKPDFTLMKNGEVLMILDTKYKYPFNNLGKVKVETDDLYQLCTYALHYQCTALCIIYPKFKEVEMTENLLARYIIPSAFGDIELKIVQIEIIDSDLYGVKEQLNRILETGKIIQASELDLT